MHRVRHEPHTTPPLDRSHPHQFPPKTDTLRSYSTPSHLVRAVYIRSDLYST